MHKVRSTVKKLAKLTNTSRNYDRLYSINKTITVETVSRKIIHTTLTL